MSKHTPGPWAWKFHSGYYVLEGSDGTEVLDDGSAGGEYGRAIKPDSPDGHLVQAAADLYAALADLVEAGEDCWGPDRPCVRVGREALARAEGRT
jgi:hypothetical protein